MKLPALLLLLCLWNTLLSAQIPMDTIPLGCYQPLPTNDRGYVGYVDQHALWKSQVIPYEFLEGFPDSYQQNVLDALQTLQANTNLCFVPRRVEAVKIGVNIFNNNLYSYANLENQTINLSDFSQSTILHEMGHLLGLCHEHQRPDRGQHVAIFHQNILSGFEPQFDIIPAGLTAQMTAAYDITSIMQYPSYAFSKNGLSTITNIDFGVIPYNSTLSPLDIQILRQAYPVAIDCQKAALERPPKAAFERQQTKKICSYTLYSFKNKSVGAETYAWSAPDAVPSSGTDSVFSVYFPRSGDFKVTLKAINPFGSSEKTIAYNVEDCIQPKITALNPSPATDYLEFALSSLVPEDFNIRVYAMNGQEVVFLQAHTQQLGLQTYRLDLPVLPQGVYLLVLDVYGTVLSRGFLVGH